MENKNIIVFIVILILLISVVSILLFTSGIESGSSSGNSSPTPQIPSIKQQFNDSEKTNKISNFTSMSKEEKEKYVNKLALSKGYEIFNQLNPEDGFEIWYAINDTYDPEKGIHIIIQTKTGEVAIYNLP